MNELKLSKRLFTVFCEIPTGAVIADIGSDHAYLPCYAYLKGRIKQAVAGEVVEGPLQLARNRVKEKKLEKAIDVRKGDGLQVIKAGEVDAVIIAGMGGTLITTILEEGKKKLKGVSRLILQPNVAAVHVRRWLYNNYWELIKEYILEEDGKIYEVLVAERGNPDAPYESDKALAFLTGPFLMEEKSHVFVKKWKHEVSKWRNIYSNLEQAKQTNDIIARKKDLKEQIEKVEEML